MSEQSALPPSRRPWSIRRRLVVGLVALVAVLGVLIGTMSVQFLRQNLIERLDAQVLEIMRSTSVPGGQIPGGPDITGLVLAVSSPRGVAQGAVVVSPDQSVALTAAQVVQVLSASSSEVMSLDVDGLGAYRIASHTTTGGTELAVGLPMTEVDQTTWALTLIFALVTSAALVLAAAGAVWIVRAALRPLNRVAETATRVAELELSSGDVAIAERVPDAEADPRTEVGQVGAAFNTMLGHVEAALVARQHSEEKVRAFVADASHELRTPLASIRGYAELTRRSGERLPEGAERSLDRIESESIRMTALVEDLLELARLDEGRALAIGQVELVRLVTDAVGDAYTVAPDHEWEVIAPDTPVIVEGDAARLQQVIVNLLANARIHTPDGTAVTVTVTETDDEATIVVADNGPGIPDDVRPTLFERFARGDSSRSRTTGSTGLGLAIVAAVVQAHGGTITAHSAAGDTRFTVALPRRAEAGIPTPSPEGQ